MARLFDDASSQELSRSGAIATAEPLSFGGWFNTDDTAANQTVFSLGNNGATGYYRLVLLGGTGGDPIAAIKQNDAGTTTGTASTSSGFSANTWHHGLAVFTNDTSRASYIDGGSKGTDTTNVADPSADFSAIGSLKRSSSIQFMSGLIAEVGVWNVALGDADALQLASGVSPLLVRPDALIAYWPLIGNYSPEPDFKGGTTLTLVNTPTTGAHPRIFYPASPWISHVPAVAAAGQPAVKRMGGVRFAHAIGRGVW